MPSTDRKLELKANIDGSDRLKAVGVCQRVNWQVKLQGDICVVLWKLCDAGQVSGPLLEPVHCAGRWEHPSTYWRSKHGV
jgi:hypothetical protein